MLGGRKATLSPLFFFFFFLKEREELPLATVLVSEACFRAATCTKPGLTFQR